MKLEELEGEVQGGFESLRSMINGHRAMIESSTLEWQRNFGSSDSDP
jgi:hypothetical protein